MAARGKATPAITGRLKKAAKAEEKMLGRQEKAREKGKKKTQSLGRLALNNSRSEADVRYGTFKEILSDPIIPDNSLEIPNSQANISHSLDKASVSAQVSAQLVSNLRNSREKRKAAARTASSRLSNPSRMSTSPPVAMVLDRPASKRKVRLIERAVENTPSKRMRLAAEQAEQVEQVEKVD